ncbi:unnamed protein product [Arctogadus glacialis]
MKCSSLVDHSTQCSSLVDHSTQCSSLVDHSTQCSSLVDPSTRRVRDGVLLTCLAAGEPVPDPVSSQHLWDSLRTPVRLMLHQG